MNENENRRNSKKNFKLKKEVLFWRSGLVGYGMDGLPK